MALPSDKDRSFSFSSDLKFSEKMPDWLDLGHVLSHVAISFTPVIDISLLNYRIGVGDGAASQKKGRGQGDRSHSSLSLECHRSTLMSPRSWRVDFSQISLFIFA